MNFLEHILWVDKYRPKQLDEYVWRDQELRNKVEDWIKTGSVPNLLLSGRPGVGKTSIAKLIIQLLAIPQGDVLEVNASKDRQTEVIIDKITSFASTWALNDTGIKYIILDEADCMMPLAQKVLRGEIEACSSVCRFFFTCNYPEKLIPAIHSRLMHFHFSALDKDDFIARSGEILVREDVEFDINTLVSIVDETYPDLRRCIGLLEKNTIQNKLHPSNKEDTSEAKDYLINAIQMFIDGKTIEARKYLVSKAQIEDYVDIYKYFYQNLDLWGETEDQKDQALLIIRKGLLNHGMIADAEINLSATMVELAINKRGS